MYEPLYDEHAGRLHAYCWSLIGEDAPSAVHDALVSAARQGGPRGPIAGRETELWLYGLARSACLHRETTYAVRSADPLDRAAATLRPDQREVLALSAGGRLEIPEIAALLGVAADTLAQLRQTGRTRLERGVLDALLHGPVRTGQEELLTAFEKGTLDVLFASRMPTEPPADLRDVVLISCAAEAARPPAGPRVMISTPEQPAERSDRTRPAGTALAPEKTATPLRRTRRAARITGTVGVAAAAGLFTTLISSSADTGFARNSSRHLAAAGSRDTSLADTSRMAATLRRTGASPASSASSAADPLDQPSTNIPPGVLPPPATSARGPQGTVQPPDTPRPVTPPTDAASPSAPSSSPSTPPSSTSPATPTPAPSDTRSATPSPSSPAPTPSTSP